MKKERDDLKGHLETEKNQIRLKYLNETIKLMESIDKDENIFYHNAVGALQEGPKGEGTTQIQ